MSSKELSKGAHLQLDEGAIWQTLKLHSDRDASRVREVLVKASAMQGLDPEDVAVLATISDPELIHELFETAKKVKEGIYGRRLVLFAPLYVTNLCQNECLYCAFRASNKDLVRRSLTQDEIAAEVKIMIDQGHKRLLLVAGESYPKEGFQYVLDCLDTIYKTTHNAGEVRRANVNVAPLSVEEFKQLKAAGIGTYQIFQETYHHETYHKVHLGGKKKNYEYRIDAMDRAMEAGIDDVGVGVLFGLADWRFEVLALMQHVRHLEQKFGVGPHTISVPRLEPAHGSDMASHPPRPVGDLEFRKIVAILRLAVPYTGLIMSTRESAEIRRETFALGVSQISAGSRTNPAGYADEKFDASQFSLGDHRGLDEVIRDITSLGYIPSFCTACYRLGRTGADFMDLARPGDIKDHCDPNALSSFVEFLLDYSSPETKEVGEKSIGKFLDEMTPQQRKNAETMMKKVREGKRDIYC